MQSILQRDERCFLCGLPANGDPLDWHHCFGGANRKKSEQYGLKVLLHHSRCHIFGMHAVHQDIRSRQYVQQAAQRAAMEAYDWTTDDFIRLFGKNYILEV